MEKLLPKARLVLGEQDWAAWEWQARAYGPGIRAPQRIEFQYEGGAFVRTV